MTLAQPETEIYDPTCFEVETLDQAVKVILTPEDGMTSTQRWRNEAPVLMKLIVEHLEPAKRLILDYGCGVGRLAKPLIGYHDCTVIGADISASMRALATSCVDSEKFASVAPEMLPMFGDGFAASALAIWTLQHCLFPKQDIGQIATALRPNGKLFVVNNVTRAIPVQGHRWADDQIDIRALLEHWFIPIAEGQLDESIAPGSLRETTFWAVYQKR